MTTTKFFLICSLISSTSFMLGQTTVNSKVSAALDDHEERISGALPQGGTVGDMIVGSTGLELGNETATTNPQLIGLRFTNITVPKFATVMSAYIQFTVKGTSKNTDPCTLAIYSENNVNPLTFSDAAFSLSTRSLTLGSITWNIGTGTWATINAAGTDQKTSDIKALITPIVFKSNWVSGNPMAFFIKGPGTREAYSFEGDPTRTAELVITYSVAGSNTVTTGIHEMSANSSINVYPNPFKNSFNVNVEVDTPSDVVISVYDLTGKLVEEKIVKQAASGTLHYTSVSQLNSGMYFVKILANNKLEVIKLISE